MIAERVIASATAAVNRVVVAFALVVACRFSLPAQAATVTRNVNLRSTPSTDQAPQEVLHPPAAVTLIDPSPTAGYYHVRAKDNAVGWVWAPNIALASGPRTPDAAIVAAPTPPKDGGYASDKASCPPVGMHPNQGVMTAYATNSDGGLRNLAKRHIPVGSSPVTLDLPAFQALQHDVDLKFSDAHTTKTLFQPTRDALTNLKFAGGTVSEGQLVQIAAYVNAARGEGSESVNCASNSANATATQDGTDIHINVGAKGSTEFKGIVVEMIPQLPRPAGWDTTTLRKLKDAALQVLVVGGLTYDNEHFVNDDALHLKTGQPKRMSLWEVHPITAFLVCVTAPCDVVNKAQWTSLTEWAKKHP